MPQQQRPSVEMEQTDNSKSSSGRCACCQKATPKNCGGCLGAPAYDQGPGKGTFYCNTQCQKADWNRHKTKCKALQARTSLHRAAVVLQATMCRIRKNAYPLSVTSVRVDGTKIILDGPQTDEKGLLQHLQPFPVILDDGREILEAALMHLSSADAMIYLYSLAKELFDGLYSNLEEVDFISTNHKLQVFAALEATTPVEPPADRHCAYKVTMKNGEIWAVDVTGARYGYPDTLCPWSRYEREHCQEINGQRTLGFFRHQPDDFYESWKGAKVTKTEEKALAEALDRQIPLWAAAYGGNLNTMLKGSGITFQAARQKFLDQVETYVRVTLAEMHGHSAEINKGMEGTSSSSAARADIPAGNLYCIKAISGKGQGMIAASKIPKGARILSETPIFRVPRDDSDIQLLERIVTKEVGCLSGSHRQAFFALHNIYGGSHSHALGIARTNALPLGSDASQGGLFLEASRINHSCRHNAQNTWNSAMGKLTIHAFKDIEEGDEITISYLSASENYAARQTRLKATFDFDCACDLCSLPIEQRLQSDQRLDKITRLDERIGDGMSIISTPKACLYDARELLRLLVEEEVLDARIPRLYYDSLQIAIANSDQARARVFAQRAHTARVILEGGDSPEAIRLKAYAERPSSHRLYGTSMKWKQAVAKIPQSLSEGEFEDWLWKKRG